MDFETMEEVLEAAKVQGAVQYKSLPCRIAPGDGLQYYDSSLSWFSPVLNEESIDPANYRRVVKEPPAREPLPAEWRGFKLLPVEWKKGEGFVDIGLGWHYPLDHLPRFSGNTCYFVHRSPDGAGLRLHVIEGFLADTDVCGHQVQYWFKDKQSGLWQGALPWQDGVVKTLAAAVLWEE